MKLLFVCTGNICRSPMAEGIARRLAQDMRLDVTVDSAGTLGLVDRPADPKAIKVCKELGIDLRAHRSKGLDRSLVDGADAILVMEPEHAATVRQRYPDVPEDRVELLGPWVGEPAIPDPIGGWIWTFRANRRMIEQAVAGWMMARVPPA